jgi:glycosyltransferase involved in cell wall biosynthesis
MTAMTSLLIDGWRDINHSYALVNQYQILAFLKTGHIHLFHRDMPFASANWNPQQHSAGFSQVNTNRISALQAPGSQEPIDALYRICSPIRNIGFEYPNVPRLTFIVTEFGLSVKSFQEVDEPSTPFTDGANWIVTPSQWSRDRIVDWGFVADKVVVVPHGVCTNTFFPLSEEEGVGKRSDLGLQPDETVFLNLGAAIWNKGLDLLVRAFAAVRLRGRKVRLILKDQGDLYGVSSIQMLRDLRREHPALLTADVLNAILVVSANLSPAKLRLLYGVADCYVSPYRAEGFNLPVLEAIACGTPAIVTAGGATDDFCDARVAMRVDSTLQPYEDSALKLWGRYREPNFDALVEAMDRFGSGSTWDRNAFEKGRQCLVDRLTWDKVVYQLLNLMELDGFQNNRPSA